MNRFKSINIIASVLLLSALLFASCEKDPILKPKGEAITQIDKDKFKYIPWIEGEAYVKISKESKTKSARVSILDALSSLSSLTKGESNFKIEPVFDISGEYAVAMRREGLDRWYKITFDKSIKVQSVLDELNDDSSVEFVHGALPIEQSKVNYTPYSAYAPVSTKSDMYPDLNKGYKNFTNPDPLLTKQWHYSNTGEQSGFEVGADINLFEAWNHTTGTDDVIVAVIDSGIDFTHEDLQDAKWGTTGGRNFVDTTKALEAGYHGTHVAGTIGARNNNGKGVAGVAGGNGTTEKGVKLMSCQIFGKDLDNGKTDGTAGYDQIARAFVWAAQNGAVIVNCSWGYPWRKWDAQTQTGFTSPEDYKQAYATSSKVIQEGIAFFIKYAGNDPNTTNKKAGSLMSGGVVFFASGNESTVDVEIVPSSSPLVISVGAFTPNYNIAPYANTGPWVDILAPGGDLTKDIYSVVYNKGVLSTVPANFKNITISQGMTGNDLLYDSQQYYAYAQGTSMATPHVTGIAALMVSYFGKKDANFTNEKLKTRILSAVKAISHEEKNPAYKGRIGSGYIDAAYALRDPETKAPGKVEIKITEVKYYDATIQWNVTADADSPTNTAFAYDIYLSDKKISKMPDSTIVAYSFEKKEGDSLEHQFTGLESNKTYYVSIVARDRSGNKSDMVVKEFKTLLNNVPEFVNKPAKKHVILNTQPYFSYTYKVVEKDKHDWRFTNSELPRGATIVRNGNDLVLTVIVDEKVGTYSFEVVLIDELNGKKVEKIEYEIVNHSAPKVVADLKDISLFEKDAPLSISLKNIFLFTSGTKLQKFEVESNNTSVALAKIENDTIIITPLKKGTATITITADDGVMKTSAVFQVNVTDKSTPKLYALYPVPAHSYIKMLFHPNIKNVNVTVSTIRGELIRKTDLIVDDNSHEATLDIDKIVPGIYYLIIKSGGTTIKRTFVKN